MHGLHNAGILLRCLKVIESSRNVLQDCIFVICGKIDGYTNLLCFWMQNYTSNTTGTVFVIVFVIITIIII